MTKRAAFTKADVKRLLTGAREAGYDHVRVGIDMTTGNIVLHASADPVVITPERRNPLDRLLPTP